MESALETEDKRILKGDEILVLRRSGSRESNRTERPPRDPFQRTVGNRTPGGRSITVSQFGMPDSASPRAVS